MGKAITFIPLIVALGSILVFSEINLKDSSFLDMWRSIEWNSTQFILDEFYNLTDWEFITINISKTHISKLFLAYACSTGILMFVIIGALMFGWIVDSTMPGIEDLLLEKEDLLLEKEIVDGYEENRLRLDIAVLILKEGSQVERILTAERRVMIAKDIINAFCYKKNGSRDVKSDYIIAAINDEVERIMKNE